MTLKHFLSVLLLQCSSYYMSFERTKNLVFFVNSDILCRFQSLRVLKGERYHGGLNRNSSHRFMCLNAQFIGNGTIRRYSLA